MSEWISIDVECPEQGKHVQAWHRIHKCPITVRLVRGKNTFSGGDEWHEKTLTTYWPIQAFSHWKPLPESPESCK